MTRLSFPYLLRCAYIQVEQWTLRRCAAVCLDIMACTYADELLPTLLPALRTCFSTAGDSAAAWNARECGILALGSVAEGSGEGISEHFGVILPFLVSELKDPRVCAA